jgi:hypothetical protein
LIDDCCCLLMKYAVMKLGHVLIMNNGVDLLAEFGEVLRAI